MNYANILITATIFNRELNGGTGTIIQEQVRAPSGTGSRLETARVRLLFFNQHVFWSTAYPRQSINNAYSLKDPYCVKKKQEDGEGGNFCRIFCVS